MNLDELKSIREIWEAMIEQRAENNHLPESEEVKLDIMVADYQKRFGTINGLDEIIKVLEDKQETKKLNKEMENEELKGRAAALAAYKAANPDLQEDPDDDTLHDFRSSRYSELEGKYSELEDRHNKLNEPNIRMSEQVAKDPRLAAVFSMIAGENPKSFPYALGSVYGKEGWGLEGADLEEFEAGYQENLKRLTESEKLQAQAVENIRKYEETLLQYVKENELTEEQASGIHNGIMEFADNILMGIIPVELIDLVRKGLNYEKDVQEAADTGFVEGKNDAVDAKLKKPETPSVPDLGNSTGAGKNTPRTPRGGLGFPD